MADKLLVVMINANLCDPAELGAPMFQATVAAAMEFDVEIIFSGRLGELAKKGVAEKLMDNAVNPRNVYDYIKDAHEAGVIFKVCTPTLDLSGDDLIPEIEEIVGGAYLISEAMDDDTVTFTY